MPTDYQYTYPQNAHEATLRLRSLIKESIHDSGPMSFTTYMDLALYHPELGYYTRGLENVGKSGDFFTSVSVGSCFGTILAHRIFKEWKQQGKPEQFHIIELGANTGQLAKDILDALQSTFPEIYAVAHYHIVEHLPSIIEIQSTTLAQHQGLVSHHSQLSHLGENGIIVSNELIDAFPVHLLQFQDTQWQERKITLGKNDEFQFILEPLSSDLKEQLAPVFTALPDPPEGYKTEYRPSISSFLTEAKQALTVSLILTIDYGHTRSGYYAASRKTGTLRCYHQHQADENPLELPGLKDITAHVDFTQLADALRCAGFHLTSFSSQAHYLTTHGASWLTSMENNGTLDFKLIRQFQTLIHPTTMGHQFHFLEAHSHQEEDTDTLEKLEI